MIFTRFRAEMNGVCERVEKVLGKRFSYVRIAGDVDITQRGPIVEQFQTDPDTRVFVGQIDACAEGITLTASDTVVYYSLTFNMAKYAQSQDRIHRVGQRNVCTYIHLIVPKSIDEKVMHALDKKVDLAKTLTDNWRWMLED